MEKSSKSSDATVWEELVGGMSPPGSRPASAYSRLERQGYLEDDDGTFCDAINILLPRERND
jgi:hypothetical protein